MDSGADNTIANGDWVDGLTAGRSELTTALHARIRRGLAAAFSGRSDVSDADLDDFSQDAVLRVLDRLSTFRGDSRFTTWAMAVAVRVGLTALRRRIWKTQSLDSMEHDLAATASSGWSPDASSVRGELLGLLRRSIDGELTQRQRQVLLAELDGVPQVVLADRLSSTPGAIYKTSHDARKKLKAVLTRAGYDAVGVKAALASE